MEYWGYRKPDERKKLFISHYQSSSQLQNFRRDDEGSSEACSFPEKGICLSIVEMKQTFQNLLENLYYRKSDSRIEGFRFPIQLIFTSGQLSNEILMDQLKPVVFQKIVFHFESRDFTQLFAAFCMFRTTKIHWPPATLISKFKIFFKQKTVCA